MFDVLASSRERIAKRTRDMRLCSEFLLGVERKVTRTEEKRRSVRDSRSQGIE